MQEYIAQKKQLQKQTKKPFGKIENKQLHLTQIYIQINFLKGNFGPKKYFKAEISMSL